DPATKNLDPAAVAAAVTPRTAAVLPVHFAGLPCDTDGLLAVAERHGLVLIEDCAHAIEAADRGRPCGTVGRFGCFSFYATKNVTTAEGGMLLCRDAADAARARTLSLHGLSRDAYDRYAPDAGADRFRHYAVVEPGYKYNLTDLAAALGLHQLARVEANLARRRNVWDAYRAGLAGLDLNLPAEPKTHQKHARHLYTVELEEPGRRDAALDSFLARGIGVGVHYLSLPDHPWYRRELGWSPDAWPVAREIGRTTLSLPLTAGLTDDDAGRVVRETRDVVRGMALATPFWEERATRLGPRAVFNLHHPADQLDAVTETQRHAIFPALRSLVRGDEGLALDFGCGTGRFTDELAELIGGRAVGVDPTLPLIERATATARTRFMHCPDGRVGLSDSSAGLVFVGLVLGGLRGRRLVRAVAEVRRVLRPGGLLVLVENTSDLPDAAHWAFRREDEYRAMFPGYDLQRVAEYDDLGERISVLAGHAPEAAGAS
ncbi:MAG: DegT/DnrJ/EryC1/StrS family aminotransferase, partial [Planctomycetota bacterium]